MRDVVVAGPLGHYRLGSLPLGYPDGRAPERRDLARVLPAQSGDISPSVLLHTLRDRNGYGLAFEASLRSFESSRGVQQQIGSSSG